MRDAFGGVFMMRLMLVFIVILVAFTAISYKYAKSFRIKNAVIDFVEQNQIKDLNYFFNSADDSRFQKINSAIFSSRYNIRCSNGNGPITDDIGTIGYCYNGIKIMKNETKSKNRTIVYNVYTYVDWDLGVLNKLLLLGGESEDSQDIIDGVWTITGEAVVKY